MQSLRLLSRQAPRLSARQFSLRPISSLPRQTLLRASWQQTTRKPSLATFSTSVFRREPAGDSDLELIAKLDQERMLEEQSADSKSLPEKLEDELKASGFRVEDIPGTHDVALIKKFGNEDIRIEFSVNDMQAPEEEFDIDPDSALADEEDLSADPAGPGQRRGINQPGSRGGKIAVAPEDSIAPADNSEEYGADGAQTQSYPLTLSIRIEKPGKGVAEFRAVARDGAIEVDSAGFFPDLELLEPSTPDAIRQAHSAYSGPPFQELDPDLISMFERYLDERGINTQLAAILPDYVEFKEQREYVAWLQNMRSFVEA